MQLGEVIERVDFIQFAGMDNAHEQVAHPGTVESFVEAGVFSVQNRLLQGPFADIIVQRRTGLSQEQRQFLPVPKHISNRLAQSAVGFNLFLFELLSQPDFQFRHFRAAVSLMPLESLLMGQALAFGLVVMGVNRLEYIQNIQTLLREMGRHLNKTPPAMRQTVTQDRLERFGRVTAQGITHLNRRIQISGAFFEQVG